MAADDAPQTELPDYMVREREWLAEEVEAVHASLAGALQRLEGIREKTGGTRSLSNAQTRTEEALFWVKDHGHNGRWNT